MVLQFTVLDMKQDTDLVPKPNKPFFSFFMTRLYSGELSIVDINIVLEFVLQPWSSEETSLQSTRFFFVLEIVHLKKLILFLPKSFTSFCSTNTLIITVIVYIVIVARILDQFQNPKPVSAKLTNILSMSVQMNVNVSLYIEFERDICVSQI